MHAPDFWVPKRPLPKTLRRRQENPPPGPKFFILKVQYNVIPMVKELAEYLSGALRTVRLKTGRFLGHPGEALSV